MTQNELDREVAAALGEDLCEIRRRGFSLANPNEEHFDSEPDDLSPQVVDWDRCEAERRVPMVPQPSRRLKVA